MTAPEEPRPASPDAEYVAHIVRAGHWVGRTFEAIVRAAQHDCGGDVDTGTLRRELDALVAAGVVARHPGFTHRYVHRDYLPPRALASLELPVSISVLSGWLADVVRGNTTPARLTTDHIDIVSSGKHGRHLVIYDRPVTPRYPSVIPFPKLQGPT